MSGDEPAAAAPDDRAPRAALALVGIGALAAAMLVDRPAGLGVTILAAAVLAVAVRPREPWAIAWCLGAVALASVATLRDAAWIVWPCLMAAALLGSVAATGGAAWWSLTAAGARAARLDRGLALVVRNAADVAPQRAPLVGAGLAVLLLAVFVPLFATADAAFAHLLGEVAPNLENPAGRLVTWVGVVAVGGAMLYARPTAPLKAPGRTLGRVEARVPLIALVVLFGAFVALQISTLYAGHDHVLRTAGLTYAEYAREGFAQLLAAAALTLAVIAAAARWAPGHRLLLGALCLLTLVVLASALTRLDLYMEAYGFTRARLTAQATILWLGGVFLLLLMTRARHLPRAALALSAAALLAFAISNPDRRIAERNVGALYDATVLQSLSADAAPALPCELADLPEPDGIVSMNLARAQARDAC